MSEPAIVKGFIFGVCRRSYGKVFARGKTVVLEIHPPDDGERKLEIIATIQNAEAILPLLRQPRFMSRAITNHTGLCFRFESVAAEYMSVKFASRELPRNITRDGASRLADAIESALKHVERPKPRKHTTKGKHHETGARGSGNARNERNHAH